MAQYIDKDALMAEIERIENELNHEIFTDECLGKRLFCSHIKSFINTLEVKDVNINKEISQFVDANFEKATIGNKLSLRRVAKHFFELGMAASNKAQMGGIIITQEEKLEEAKKLYETANADQRYILERLFPCLKESEDERIRKGLIDYFDDANKADVNPLQNYGIHTNKVIAWLEKQSVQKQDPCEHCKDRCLNCHNFPCIDKRTFEQGKSALEAINEEKVDNANKVEAKFKAGDWVVRGNITAQILDVQEQYYVGIDTNGNDFTSSRFLSDDKIHLYTIQDAKDGDVIFYDNGWACIFKNIHGIWYSSYCFITADGEFHTGYEEHAIDSKINGNVKPATKEQRDTFFAKMKDAGFTFDFKKKELKKIEQSSAWSEEDENNLNDAVWAVREIYTNGCGEEEMESWLKSLKERVQPHPRQKWSEEDEYLLGETIQHLEELIRIEKVKHCGIDVQYYQRDIDWLESLKDRVQSQNTWKPSDEQMDALETAVSLLQSSALESLYQILKGFLIG